MQVRIARRLIDTQFPEFSDLDLIPVESGGTDHTLFRLGSDLSVRFPNREDVVSQVEKEHAWLPRLSAVSVRIPRPVAKGLPDEGFPYAWSVYDWCPGDALSDVGLSDWGALASDLADFLADLRSVSITNAPLAGSQNHFRGVALAERNDLTLVAIKGISDEYSEMALLALWHDALSAAPHAGSQTWLHGDLQGGNLLIESGRLSAVIDFGLCGVGDPACDLMVAWSVLTKDGRGEFRDLLACDDASWARGRGWALSVATIALDYYRSRNPHLSRISRRTLEAILQDD